MTLRLTRSCGVVIFSKCSAMFNFRSKVQYFGAVMGHCLQWRASGTGCRWHGCAMTMTKRHCYNIHCGDMPQSKCGTSVIVRIIKGYVMEDCSR